MSSKKDAPASANKNNEKSSSQPMSTSDDDDGDDDGDDVIKTLLKKNEEETAIETIEEEPYHKENDDNEVIETTQDREIGRKYAINDAGNIIERDDNLKAKTIKRARKSNDKTSGSANGKQKSGDDKPIVNISHNQKYKNEELDYFLDLLEEILPSAPDEWDYLVKKYNAKFIDLPRSYSNLRKKYNYMAKELILITDPNIPKSILRAKLVKKAVVDKCEAEIRYNIPPDINDDVLVQPTDNNDDDVHAPKKPIDAASKAEDTVLKGIVEMNSPKPSHLNFANNRNIDSNENNNFATSQNMDTNEIMNYIIIQDQLQSRKQDEFYRQEKKRKRKEQKKEKKIRKKQKKELKRMKKRERVERKRQKHQKWKETIITMEREQRFQDNFNKQLMLMAMLFGKNKSNDIDMNQIASLFGTNNAAERPQVPPGYSSTNDGISEDTTDDSSDSSTTSSSSSGSSSASISDNDSNKKKRAKKTKKSTSINKKTAGHDSIVSTTVTPNDNNNNKIDLTEHHLDQNKMNGKKKLDESTFD